jgi:hypothetical protein
MKGGYVCLGFQPISVMMNDSNQLNKFWMSYSSINQKGMQDYLDIPKLYAFIQSSKTLLKNQIMSFFCTLSLILLSKPLECKFVIKKINLIILMNAFVLWFKILTLIPQNLVICHTKNLCHHIKYILFYFWF